MNRILSMLRSPGAMMVALVAILAAQGEHTAQVIAYFSHSGGEPLAYAFAFAIEVAVLLFVMNGHKRISYGFAVATFFTNVIYYAIGGVELLSIAIAPVLLLSVLPPAAIVGYSHTIADKPIQGTTPATKQPAKARRYRWQFWRKPAETPTTNVQPIEPVKTPVALPAGTLGHSSASAPTDAAPVESPKVAKTVRKVNEYGMTDAQLAALLNVKRQAIAPMRTRGTLTTRVARELPQLEPVHTNGYNHNNGD